MATEFFEFEKKYSDGIRRRSRRPALQKSASEIIAAKTEAHEIKEVFPVFPLHDQEGGAAEEKKSIDTPVTQKKKRTSPNEDVFYSDQEEGGVFSPVSEEREKTVLSSVTHFAREQHSSENGGNPLSLPDEIKKDKKTRMLWWGGATGIGFLAGAMLVLSFYFSRLTVSVSPSLSSHNLSEVTIALDQTVSELRLDTRTIPAERLEFSETEKIEFAGSEKKYVEEKARGTVKIYNNFSGAPQNLVASTRFLSNTGALYRLPKSVTVPGALVKGGKLSPRFVEVELIADKTGEGGNRNDEVLLTIPGFRGTPKYDGFYASAENGFSGGMKGESTRAARGDIARAQEEATKKVYDKLKQSILKKTPPDFKALDGLREIEIIKVSSPRVNEPGDRFVVAAEARGRVLIFQEKDLITVLEETLGNNFQGKERLDPTRLDEIQFLIKSIDFENGKAELAVQGNVYGKSIVPRDEIASLLAGRTKESLIEVLTARADLRDFTLELFPLWIRSAPHSTSQIKIKIEE